MDYILAAVIHVFVRLPPTPSSYSGFSNVYLVFLFFFLFLLFFSLVHIHLLGIGWSRNLISGDVVGQKRSYYYAYSSNRGRGGGKTLASER